jgi:hypothetical protein
MSGHGYELPGRDLDLAERAKGRRTLLGISTLYLGVALIGFNVVRPLPWLGAVAVIVGAVLAMSRPQGTGRSLTARNIRRIARIAAVPEVGAIVLVYGCLIVGFAGAITILATTI